jgi:hypothetical protein
MRESKYVCMNCLIELKQNNSHLEDMGDNYTHVFCDKCNNEGIDVNIPPYDCDKIGEVTEDNKESWGMESKNMTYNIDGHECMFAQASPRAKTIDVFIDGKYQGLINVKDIIGEYL